MAESRCNIACIESRVTSCLPPCTPPYRWPKRPKHISGETQQKRKEEFSEEGEYLLAVLHTPLKKSQIRDKGDYGEWKSQKWIVQNYFKEVSQAAESSRWIQRMVKSESKWHLQALTHILTYPLHALNNLKNRLDFPTSAALVCLVL